MKIVLCLAILNLGASIQATACPEDTTEYNGNCYRNVKPSETDNIPDVKPSDERPPRDKMPSYEREGIHAETPPSLISVDAKMDATRDQADADGKKAAGVPK